MRLKIDLPPLGRTGLVLVVAGVGAVEGLHQVAVVERLYPVPRWSPFRAAAG